MFDFLKAPGKMEITTDKMTYSFGETVKGKVILAMDGPKSAKALKLEFNAFQDVPVTDQKGKRSRRTKTVHTFKTDLDGEHEYAGTKEYDFELKIPAQQELKLPEGTLGQVAGVAIAAAQMSGMIPGQVKWYVKASLDISGGKDASKQIQLNVA